MKKIAISLVVCMLLAMLGASMIGVSAAEVEYVSLDLANGNITIDETGFFTGDAGPYAWTGNYIIKSTGTDTDATASTIKIEGTTTKIILDNVNMSATKTMISIEKNSDVTLILRGENKVKFKDAATTNTSAGTAISVHATSKLTIDAESATDSLEVLGGFYGAAIGSAQDSYTTSAQIVINAGIINATTGGNANGSEGAAIGGARNAGAQVTINGGVITATSIRNGAAIGAGRESPDGSTVTINGGIVKTDGGTNAMGIGGGFKSTATITINGGIIEADTPCASTGFEGIGYGVDWQKLTTSDVTNYKVTVNGGSIKTTKQNGGADSTIIAYASDGTGLVKTAVTLPTASAYVYVDGTAQHLDGVHTGDTNNTYYMYLKTGTTPKLQIGDKEVTVTPGTAVAASDWTTASSSVSAPTVNIPEKDTVKVVDVSSLSTSATTTQAITAPTTAATTTAATTTAAGDGAEATTTAATTTAAEEEGGCGSAIGVSSIALIASAAVLGAAAKKKKED